MKQGWCCGTLIQIMSVVLDFLLYLFSILWHFSLHLSHLLLRKSYKYLSALWQKIMPLLFLCVCILSTKTTFSWWWLLYLYPKPWKIYNKEKTIVNAWALFTVTYKILVSSSASCETLFCYFIVQTISVVVGGTSTKLLLTQSTILDSHNLFFLLFLLLLRKNPKLFVSSFLILWWWSCTRKEIGKKSSPKENVFFASCGRRIYIVRLNYSPTWLVSSLVTLYNKNSLIKNSQGRRRKKKMLC